MRTIYHLYLNNLCWVVKHLKLHILKGLGNQISSLFLFYTKKERKLFHNGSTYVVSGADKGI